MGMEPTVKEMAEFLHKLQASRINLIDEIMYESKIQREKLVKARSSTRFNELAAEISNLQGSITAFREQIDIARLEAEHQLAKTAK
jgi:hypothetical protein